MSETWEHSIDGVPLNDFEAYATIVPEALAGGGVAVLLTEMQARSPVFNRQQPMEGKFTFLTYILWDDQEDYQTKLAVLRALYGPGAHTYAYTAPGQSLARSATIYFDGPPSVDIFGIGAVTARAIAPEPALT